MECNILAASFLKMGSQNHELDNVEIKEDDAVNERMGDNFNIGIFKVFISKSFE